MGHPSVYFSELQKLNDFGIICGKKKLNIAPQGKFFSFFLILPTQKIIIIFPEKSAYKTFKKINYFLKVLGRKIFWKIYTPAIFIVRQTIRK